MTGFKTPFRTQMDPMQPAVTISVIAWFAALKASGDGEVAWEIMLLMNMACQKESHVCIWVNLT